jgi:hypothetical protein
VPSSSSSLASFNQALPPFFTSISFSVLFFSSRNSPLPLPLPAGPERADGGGAVHPAALPHVLLQQQRGVGQPNHRRAALRDNCHHPLNMGLDHRLYGEATSIIENRNFTAMYVWLGSMR